MTSPITGASAGQGTVGHACLFRVVADELPGAGAVFAGALDDEAALGPHDEDAADAPSLAGLVDEDRAAVDERRLHVLTQDLDDAALAGGEAVAGEPPAPELHSTSAAGVLKELSAPGRPFR